MNVGVFKWNFNVSQIMVVIQDKIFNEFCVERNRKASSFKKEKRKEKSSKVEKHRIGHK